MGRDDSAKVVVENVGTTASESIEGGDIIDDRVKEKREIIGQGSGYRSTYVPEKPPEE